MDNFSGNFFCSLISPPGTGALRQTGAPCTCGRALIVLLLLLLSTGLFAQNAQIDLGARWFNARGNNSADCDGDEASNAVIGSEYVFDALLELRAGPLSSETPHVFQTYRTPAFFNNLVSPDQAKTESFVFDGTSPGTTFDFRTDCVGIDFTSFQHWEHDKNPLYVPDLPAPDENNRGCWDNDDFYQEHTNLSSNLRQYLASNVPEYQTGNLLPANANGGAQASFFFNYERNSLLTGLVAVDTSGTVIDGAYCRGGEGYWKAQVRPGYTGFKMQWERIYAGFNEFGVFETDTTFVAINSYPATTEDLESFPDLRVDGTVLRVPVERNVRYRVTAYTDPTSCMPLSVDPPVISGLFDILPAYSDPANLIYEITPSCGFEPGTGTLEILSLIGIQPTEQVELSLKDMAGVITPLSTTAGVGGVFEGLYTGEYTLFVTVIQQGSGVECLSTLTLFVDVVPIAIAASITFEQPAECNGGVLNAVVEAGLGVTQAGGTDELVYQLGVGIPGNGNIIREIRTNNLESALQQVVFMNVEPELDYYVVITNRENGCEPLVSDVFTAPDIGTTPMVRSSSRSINCPEDNLREILVSVTNDNSRNFLYTVDITTATGTVYQTNMFGADTARLIINDQDISQAELPLTVTVTSEQFCESVPQIVTFTPTPAPVRVFASVIANPSTCNETNGEISVKIVGGEAPYSLQTSAGAVNQITTDSFVVSSLTTGPVYIFGIDANGCFGDFPRIELYNQDAIPLTLSVPNVISTSCAGANDASFTATSSGGSGTRSYQIQPGPTGFFATNTFTNLGPGLYTVTVMDDGTGCTTSTEVSVVNPGQATVSDVVFDGGWCPDDAYTLTLTLDAPPGFGFINNVSSNPNCIDLATLRISLDGGATYQTYPSTFFPVLPFDFCGREAYFEIDLLPGEYDIRLQINEGCGGTIPFTISAADFVDETLPAITNVSIDQPNCDNESGSITVDFIPGVDRSQLVLLRYTSNDNLEEVARSFYFSNNGATNSTIFRNVPVSEIISSADGAHAGGYVVRLETGYFYQQSIGWRRRPTISCDVYSPQGAGPAGSGSFVQYEMAPLNAAPVANHVWTNPDYRCDGSLAEITLSATGGLPPYEYSFSGGSFSAQSDYVTNSDNSNETGNGPAITYQVRDANGCLSELISTVSEGVLLDELEAATFTVLSPFSTCSDFATIQVELTGGTPPFIVEFGINQTSRTTVEVAERFAIVNVPRPESFDFGLGEPDFFAFAFVADFAFCTISSDFSIPDLIEPSVSVISTGVSCPDAADGSLEVTVDVSGAPPFMASGFRSGTVNGVTYTTNPFTATGLGIGGYNIVIEDEQGCLQVVSATVAETNPVVFQPEIVNAGPCATDATGSISVFLSGGSPPYSLSLDGGPAINRMENEAAIFTDLLAGEYSLLVTDQNGCTTDYPFLVGGPQPFFATLIGQTNPACAGVDDGLLSFDVRGGNKPLRFSLDGGPEQDSSVFVNLAAGTYNTLLVTDANACTFTYDLGAGAGAVLVNQSNVTASVVVTDAACRGEATGAVTLNGSGGTAAYQYALGTGAFQPGNTFTGLMAGTYDFTVRDANGCTFGLTGVAVGEPAEALSATATITDVLCAGQTNGRITIAASGGTPGYTYALNGGTPISAATFNNLAAGTYSVLVTDNRGCTFSLNDLVVNEPTPLGGTLDVRPPSCFGGEDGRVAAIPTGGTPPYAYRLFGLPSGPTDYGPDSLFTNLPPGSYAVRWQDANGCETPPQLFTLADGDVFTLQVTAQTAATCGEDNGSATVSPLQGGVGTITYAWTGGRTGPDQSNLAPGVYSVTATDDNSCTATLDVVIEDQPAPVITDRIGVNSGCTDDAGEAAVVVTGGLPPYTFNWSPGNTDSLQTGLSAGRYFVTVTDANLCTTTDSVDVATFPLFTYTVASTADSCGQTNGTITLDITGGSGNYSVAWDPAVGGSGPVYGGLAAGNYAFTITDAGNNCSDAGSVIVDEVAGPAAVIATTNNALCVDGNGSVQIDASSGNGPLTYRWNDGSTDGPVRDQLFSGDYVVTISDATTCEVVLNVSIELELPPVVTAEIEVDTCSEGRGRIALVVSGGRPGYVFNWDDEATRTDSVATGLAAGTYTGQVEDANGCATPFSFEVLPTTAPVFGPADVTDATCDLFNGSITVSATGGTGTLTYAWDDEFTTTGPVLDNVGAGSYTVTVTDALGCFAVLPVTVNNIPGPTALAASSLTQTSCGADNGTLTLEVTGGTPGYVYTWSHDDGLTGPTATGLPAGTYDVTATDANLCAITSSFTIDPSTAITGQVLSATPATCDQDNGAATVSVNDATGTVTYVWGVDLEPMGPVATGLPAGTYNVIATDASNCNVSIEVSIGNTPAPVLAVITAQDPICNDGTGSISLSATGGTGGLTVSWSHDSELNDLEATGLFAGTYDITLTDETGCTDNITVVLNPPNLPSFGPANITSSTCAQANGAITLSISGGIGNLTYTWMHDQNITGPTATDLLAGTYTVSVTDELGCTDEIIVFLNDIPGPTSVNADLLLATICGLDNGIIELSVTGGTTPFTYEWSHDPLADGPDLADLAAGDYTVTVTDANNCTIVETFTMEESDVPMASVVSLTDATCGEANGAATVATTGLAEPLTYVWGIAPEPNGPEAIGLGSGTYPVMITGADGCFATVTVIINTADGPTLAATDVQDPLCLEGTGSISLTITGGTAPYAFNWNPVITDGGAVLTGLNSGNYAVTVTDANGCQLFYATTLAPPNPPTLLAPTVQPGTCGRANGSILLDATGGSGTLTYTWNHDAALTGPLAENLAGGTYSVTVTDESGCADMLTIQVEAVPGPTVIEALTQVQTTCNLSNGSLAITVAGGVEPYRYAWSHDPAADGPTLTDLSADAYTVTVTDANGCTLEQTFTIAPSLALELTVAQVIDATCDQANGSATVSVANATGNVVYTWGLTPEVTGPSATGLPAGVYVVTAEDENGCFTFIGLTIGNADGPALSVETALDPLCVEGTGSITVSATGGVEPYVFTWSHDETVTGPVASSLNSGDFTITVTDGTGCGSTLNVSLAAPDPPVFAASEIIATTCGEANGSISLTVTGGTTPLTYAWNHDSELADPVATGLAAGEYEVTVTDALACFTVETFSVGNADGPESITAPVVTNTSCGEENGALTVVVTGGASPYTYAWSHDPAADGPALTDLPADEYTVVVTDANGCSLEQTFTIAPSEPVSLSILTQTDAACGLPTGSVTVSAGNAAAPVMYTWNIDPQPGGPTATNLPAGLYTVSIEDANGCTAMTEVIIGEQVRPELVLVETADPDCGEANGQITVSATGGTEPYTYAWSHDAGLTGPVAQNLGAGSFVVTVTDVTGCTDTLTTVLSEPGRPEIASVVIADVNCDGTGGSISVNIVGGDDGLTYSWSHDPELTTASATGLAAGDYSFTVSSATGCAVDSTVVVTGAAGPTGLTLVTQTDASCGLANGSLSISVDGGVFPFTYAWLPASGNNPEITDLSAGDYSLTVTDANGCTVSAVYTVGESPALVLTNNSSTPATCGEANGMARVEVTGGTLPLTYVWGLTPEPGGPVASGLASGSYTVTVTDAAGCTLMETVTIDGTEAITVTPTIVNASCDGRDGSISLEIMGGSAPYIIVWADTTADEALLAGIPAGEYTVTVTGAAGCTATQTFTVIGEGANISIFEDSRTSPVCAGGTDGRLSVFALGGNNVFAYNWSNGGSGTEITGITAGDYTVTATDGNGCSGVLTLTLGDGAGTVFDYPVADTTICQDDILAIDLTGDYQSVMVTGDNGYSSSNIVSLVEQAGTYTLTVTDLNGCEGSDELTVNVTGNPLTAGMVLPTNMVLGDTMIVLETSFPRPDNVSWVYDNSRMNLVGQLGNQYLFTFSETGSYSLGLVAGGGGCEDLLSKQIIVHADSSSIGGGPLGRLEIRSAIVAPNPNQGQFAVDVQLSANLPLTATLYNIDGQSLDRQSLPAATNHQLSYNLTLENGTYLLSLQTAAQRRVLTVVVTN